MCQKTGESVKAEGTQSAPQTLSLDWAVSKRQSAWEHHKDGGARISTRVGAWGSSHAP